MLTDEGIQIDESDEQLANADFSKIETRDPGSKTIDERPVHSLKHFSQTTSTVDGMQITSANADFPRREIFEKIPNDTPARLLQRLKQS
jgi:hypothetical protein